MPSTTNDQLLSEAADKMIELRQERDSARQEASDLRAALTLAQMTPRLLLERIRLTGLGDKDRLVVMAQNPADSHNWSRGVSGFFTAGDVRAALEN